MNKSKSGNAIFHLLRINHWIKNGVVFIPLFFAGEISNIPLLLNTFWTFLCFCLIASSVYIVNDIADRKADALHPSKSLRPIVSGSVSVKVALIIATVLQIVGYTLAFVINHNLALILLAYFILNLLYTFSLKNYPITDITIISLGFLLRIFAGGIIADIPISMWLVIMIFLLSLFMGFAKRRDDALLFKEQHIEARKNIRKYTIGFIDISMAVLGSVIIVAYIMYTVSPDIMSQVGSEYVYVTAIFVIHGILRYLHRCIVLNEAGSPVKVLLTDRGLQITIILWLISFYFILYYS